MSDPQGGFRDTSVAWGGSGTVNKASLVDLWSSFVTRTLLALKDTFAADWDTGQSVSELNRSGGGTTQE